MDGDGKWDDEVEDACVSICRVSLFRAAYSTFRSFFQRQEKEGVQIPHPLPPTLCVWASEAKERVAEVAATEPQGSLRGSHL